LARKDAISLTRGLNASPGAACGKIVFSAHDAEAWHARGEEVLLIRKETSPEDIGGMAVAQGILTSTGGMTSHAAVVARGMGTPCIAGAKDVIIQGKTMTIGAREFKEGDWVTIDGSTGDVYEGQLPLVDPEVSKDMTTFLNWCDDIAAASKRGKVQGFQVWTNADQPEDAKRAFDFGAKGIGLCRTEHMFFDKDKLTHFRAMIVANSETERKEALKNILPLQQKDFFGIFKAMEGRPVVIRLLDPPLHEFVPHSPEEIAELAEHLKIPASSLQTKIEKLHEQNPMLGHRGCRLAVTYPEIYDMQVEAIALAAVECAKQKIPVQPEIMIPIVITARELKLLRPNAEAVLKRVFAASGVKVAVKIGTMIEVPRAAISAGHVARYADFFSFGTNDLTQMTFAFSRDDVASFLPSYLEKGVLDVDPFKSIDEDGVGFLIAHATQQGRAVNPALSVGICGEHGGDPATIDFCYRSGLSYVSCSPFRVPLARLAAAQAVLRNPPQKEKPAVKAQAVKTTAVKAPEVKTADKKTAAAEKPAAKKTAPVKKAAVVKEKKAPAKKALDKKTVAKKDAAKKPVVKKAAAKKPEIKKALPKKAVNAKKAADKKPVAKAATVKTAAKTPVAKKTPAVKKPVAKKKK